MGTAIRKARHELTLGGVGAIAFGIWLFIKNLMYPLFAGRYLTNTLGLDALSAAEKKAFILLWVLVGFFTMLLHLYIGLCAVSEGTGKAVRRRSVYLLLAGLLAAVSLFDLVFNLCNISSVSGSWLDWLCDVMMETVRGANLAALLRAALRTRKLQDQMQEEAMAHAD